MNRIKIFLVLMAGLVVSACNTSNQPTGSLTLTAQWPEATSAPRKTGSSPRITQAPKGAVTIRVIVSGDGMNTLQVDFVASANQGTLNNVPAGTNRTVTLQGISGLSTVLYQGQVSGVQVLANTVNNAGVIVMAVAASNSDSDGVPDEADDFPNDPLETTDTDTDGTGNNTDTDDDADGISDTDETTLGTNSLLVDTDGDGFSDGQERGLAMDPLLVDAELPTLLRVNLHSSGAQAIGTSYGSFSAISSDGRYIVFASDASNLVDDDSNGVSDIFRKDIVTGTTIRINTLSSGAEATGGSSTDPVISADGRYVAFTSAATNLVDSDSNGLADIFSKDIVSGAIIRVSTRSDGGQVATADSSGATMSSDGRYIAFMSAASDLVNLTNAGLTNVFRKDTISGAVLRVNIRGTGEEPIGGHSYAPEISADGRYVVFRTDATNLVASDTNQLSDIFRKEMVSGFLVRVNTGSNEEQATGGNSYEPSISADGRYVAFESEADNLVLSDNNGLRDIFRKDLETGSIIRVNTRSSGAEATGGHSSFSAISADGRYVSFRTNANNLVEFNPAVQGGIFRKDTLFDGINGVPVIGFGSNLSGSTDGCYVSFYTNEILVSNDSNGNSDFFRADLCP